MKLRELNSDEMKMINGGIDEAMAIDDGSTATPYSGSDTYPVSDGVGQTNESTYGTSDGNVRHHIP